MAAAAGVERELEPGLGFPQLRRQLPEAELAVGGRHQRLGPTGQIDHVHGQADRATLLLQVAAHGLADPPVGVGGELVAAAGIELLDRPQQADVAGLDQVHWLLVQVGHAALVALDDGDHEPQVGRHHPGHGPATPSFQIAALTGGLLPALDNGSQMQFFRRGQEGDTADGMEIIAKSI
ncbi:hypothetical protein AAF143_14215 [Cyanobium sp. ATX-6F1]